MCTVRLTCDNLYKPIILCSERTRRRPTKIDYSSHPHVTSWHACHRGTGFNNKVTRGGCEVLERSLAGQSINVFTWPSALLQLLVH